MIVVIYTKKLFMTGPVEKTDMKAVSNIGDHFVITIKPAMDAFIPKYGKRIKHCTQQIFINSRYFKPTSNKLSQKRQKNISMSSNRTNNLRCPLS
jgi:hypothetical protein